AVVPLISMTKLEPEFNVTEPVVRIPGEFPGERFPPELTITLPEIVPVPPSVPVLFTVTLPVPVPEPEVLFTSRVPPFTVVPPLVDPSVPEPESCNVPALTVVPLLYVFALLRRSVPAPALVRPPLAITAEMLKSTPDGTVP